MNIEFQWPWLFLILPLPLLVYFLVPKAEQQTGAALTFPYHGLFNRIGKGHQDSSENHLRLLLVLCWLLLTIAAARPQWVGDSIQLPISGRSLLLAVDISGSMETRDMVIFRRAVSRLDAVKAVAKEFIDRREGDYLGLILFGSKAYLQSPLSYDRKTIQILLDEAVVRLAGEQTAIGDAIGLAVKRLRKQPEQNRILVLLTDGTNTAGSVEPLKAADLAAQHGIRIYAIGVGDDEVRVRGLFGNRVIGSDLDEKTLQAIAAKTGGGYFRARDIEQLEEIYRLLDEIEPISDEQQFFRPVKELYAWPLAAALLLSFVLVVIRAKQP